MSSPVPARPSTTCGCNLGMMAGLSPMHPLHYLELACDLHRQAMQESSASERIRNYQPHNQWRDLGARGSTEAGEQRG